MKKEYTSPKLVEYGSMEDLTRAGVIDLSSDPGDNYLTGEPTCPPEEPVDLF